MLAWLSSSPDRWNTFVRNRVAKIQSGLPRENWGHVKGKDNPADCSSRGIYPSELPSHPLWWTNPDWLLGFDTASFNPEHQAHITDLEIKPVTAHVVTQSLDFTLVNQFSSWNKLIRITHSVGKRIIRASRMRLLSFIKISRSS